MRGLGVRIFSAEKSIFGKIGGTPNCLYKKLGVTPNFHKFFASAPRPAPAARAPADAKNLSKFRVTPNFWFEKLGVPPFFYQKI